MSRSQHSRTGTPTISLTKVSMAKHMPRCLPVSAESGQPAPRILVHHCLRHASALRDARSSTSSSLSEACMETLLCASRDTRRGSRRRPNPCSRRSPLLAWRRIRHRSHPRLFPAHGRASRISGFTVPHGSTGRGMTKSFSRRLRRPFAKWIQPMRSGVYSITRRVELRRRTRWNCQIGHGGHPSLLIAGAFCLHKAVTELAPRQCVNGCRNFRRRPTTWRKVLPPARETFIFGPLSDRPHAGGADDAVVWDCVIRPDQGVLRSPGWQ